MPVAAQTIWGSARNITGGPGHQIHEFDASGTYTGNSVLQVPGALGSGWGYRDGASDGQYVYFGWETGVARHNADGSGGTQIISGGAPVIGTWRALAYNPAGNNGRGSFWSGDFADGIIEVDMNGGLLTQWPNLDSWSLYGLAWDHNTGMLWGHSRQGDYPEVIEIDPSTGRTTGVVFQSHFNWPGSTGYPVAIQGGLSMWGNTLYNVLQGAPDAGATFDTAGNLTGPFSPNPRDFEGQTGSNGHLGVAVIPEPTTLALLGLGALALLRRR